MIQYRLSNRQRKELLVRGRPITIALPIAQGVSDPRALAQRLLPEIDGAAGEMIRSAEVVTVYVAPRQHGTESGLAGVLGTIVDEPGHGWCVTHEVLAVDLSPRRPRGKPLPMQWPGEVLVDGEPLRATPAGDVGAA